MRQRAADLCRRAPDELGIVADRLDIAAAAVVGKSAGLEIALLVDPELHHRFKPETVRGARPQIFALLGGGALVGRMREHIAGRKMRGPLRRVGGQLRVPAERRHADRRALAIMRGEQAGGEIVAHPNIRAQQRQHRQRRQASPESRTEHAHAPSPCGKRRLNIDG